LIVVNTQPFALIYTLVNHQHLGYILEPHVVQVNSKGKFTLTHQRIFTKTSEYFSKNISKDDFQLLKLLDELDDDFIFKKFNTERKKKIRTLEFFNKYCTDEYFDEIIRPYIEEKLNSIFLKLRGRIVYKMGNDNNPTSQEILVDEDKASVLFHFRSNNDGTRYFPTIKHKGVQVDFKYKGSEIICLSPAWMLLDGKLFDFEKNVEGKKLLPFLNKRFIQIPKSAEENYFNKFVVHLVEKYDVYADGFDIHTYKPFAKTVLSIQSFSDNKVALRLFFKYDNTTFDFGTKNKISVWLENKGGKYIFHRVIRNFSFEESKMQLLCDIGLKHYERAFFTMESTGLISEENKLISIDGPDKLDFLEWLNHNFQYLGANEIEVEQSDETSKYYIGERQIKIEVKEKRDWFDVNAVVQFGDFTFPFLSLKDHILKGRREFVMPNGMIALIPEEWFGNLSGILEFSSSEEEIQLEKHHIGLLDEISHQQGRYLKITEKLAKLKEYGEIREMPMPVAFNGTLREYQKAGFDWFYFLKDNGFGGCLADDMGLGKTIQTLALIQKEKELYNQTATLRSSELIAESSDMKGELVQIGLFDELNKPDPRQQFLQTGGIVDFKYKIDEVFAESNATYIRTSLIVVPNSLVFNWCKEAQKFTPGLKILIYTGINREKNSRKFNNYDLIISTYGTVRVDIDVLKEFKFNFIILDESQSIKNANSQSAKAVKQLKSSHKLILTGTPVENSIQELWSQMSFINPGLLGSLSYFIERFITPIEKLKDQQKLNQLKAITRPFILRRTKDQVAKELPSKTEQIIYCEMTSQQKEAYDTVKSHYRNEILKSIQEFGLPKSQFTLLQGLTKLRQIANHPVLANKEYEGESGKFEEVIAMAQTAKAEGHKVLIFSQFVSQLDIYRRHFDNENSQYCYLDGKMSSAARQKAVEDFQEKDFPYFLISLKAGGFGLNLTNADYVFLIDPWWNPAVERQAVDRTHRIGQDKNVFIYKFISKDSVEEKIIQLQEKKKALADSLITAEESFIKTFDADEIAEILS